MTDLPTPTPKPARSIHPALIFGIVFLPLIFSWFTLAKGVGKWTRLAAFGWLAAFVAMMNYHPTSDPPKAGGSETAALSSASAAKPSAAAPSAPPAADQSTAELDRYMADLQPNPDAPIDPHDHRTLGEAKASYERDMAYVQAYAQANDTCISGRIEVEPLDRSRNQIIEDITQQCVEYERRGLDAAHTKADPYAEEKNYVRGKVHDAFG